MLTLASYLINGDCKPVLVQLIWVVKKSEQFHQSDIASDIAALMLTLSVNGSLDGDKNNSGDWTKDAWIASPKLYPFKQFCQIELDKEDLIYGSLECVENRPNWS